MTCSLSERYGLRPRTGIARGEVCETKHEDHDWLSYSVTKTNRRDAAFKLRLPLVALAATECTTRNMTYLLVSSVSRMRSLLGSHPADLPVMAVSVDMTSMPL